MQWPAREWARGTPAELGLDPTPLGAVMDGVRRGRYGAVDHLLVVKDGRVVLDERLEQNYARLSRGHSGPLGCGVGTCADSNDMHDYNYLHPMFHPYYRGRPVHSLQSITKSITSALIGVAVQRGEIAGAQAPLLPFLAAYDLRHTDPRLRSVTLEDVLTMRSGIEWHEVDRPVDSTNTTLQLERSADWVQFTLDQPMDADPGAKWAYNSGTSQVLSAVLRHATGLNAADYAERHLFAPLGIRDYYWKRTPTGLSDTEGGLFLSPHDLARIGYLYLNDGVWDGVRLLPPGWVAASTTAHAERINPQGWGYGYQWWRLDRPGAPVWAGLGFGDQHLLVLPEQRIVAVVNSWNLYGEPPRQLLPDFIDALIAAGGRQQRR